MVRRVVAGRGCCLDDRIGSREVGLARAEADYVLTCGFERLGLGIDGQRGRLGDCGNAT
jgi:hypothetical protein